jgi:hypothetical protein
MFANAAVEMRGRIVARHKFISDKMSLPEPPPIKFDSTGVALLKDWRTKKDSGEPNWDQPKLPDAPALHIETGKGPTIASWRSDFLLPPGKYVLMARARASHIEPTEGVEPGVGAGIRISGGKRANKLVGDAEWTLLENEFEVLEGGDEIEFVCELRAKKGEVWFDAETIKVIKQKPEQKPSASPAK